MKLMIALDLPDHPKLLSLASELTAVTRDTQTDVTRDVTVTRQDSLYFVIKLWCWVMKFREDGNLENLSESHIAEAAGWTGEPKVFLRALVKVGIIDREPTMQVHDWQQHQGKLIRERAGNTLRQRRRREKMREKSAESVTRDIPRDITRDVTPSVPVTYPVTSRGSNRDTGNTSSLSSSSSSSNPPVPPKKGGSEGADAPAPPVSPAAQDERPDGWDGTPEHREEDLTVEAFAFCAQPTPHSKLKAIRELRRQGVTHERIREVAKANPTVTFFGIVNALENKKAKVPLRVVKGMPDLPKAVCECGLIFTLRGAEPRCPKCLRLATKVQ